MFTQTIRHGAADQYHLLKFMSTDNSPLFDCVLDTGNWLLEKVRRHNDIHQILRSD